VIFFAIKPGEMLLTIVSDILPILCSFVAIIFLWETYKAFKVHDSTRMAWLFVLIGMFLNFLGESSYSYQEIVLKIDLDNVAYSISDLFWYSSYIFCIMGLVILLKEYYKSDFPIGNPINLIICVLLLVILMAFLIVVLLLPIIRDSETPFFEKMIYLFYPIFDMIQVILACSLLFVVRKFKGGLVKAPWLLISIGFLLMGVSDIFYSYMNWNNTYGSGSFIDLGWNLGYLLIAMSGVYQKSLVKSLGGN